MKNKLILFLAAVTAASLLLSSCISERTPFNSKSSYYIIKSALHSSDGSIIGIDRKGKSMGKKDLRINETGICDFFNGVFAAAISDEGKILLADSNGDTNMVNLPKPQDGVSNDKITDIELSEDELLCLRELNSDKFQSSLTICNHLGELIKEEIFEVKDALLTGGNADRQYICGRKNKADTADGYAVIAYSESEGVVAENLFEENFGSFKEMVFADNQLVLLFSAEGKERSKLNFIDAETLQPQFSIEVPASKHLLSENNQIYLLDNKNHLLQLNNNDLRDVCSIDTAYEIEQVMPADNAFHFLARPKNDKNSAAVIVKYDLESQKSENLKCKIDINANDFCICYPAIR